MQWSSVREKQADDVLALVAAHKEKSDLVVVAGDLNATPNSAVYKKFISAGLVDTLVSLKGKMQKRFSMLPGVMLTTHGLVETLRTGWTMPSSHTETI